jgi:hypothetical protein
VALVYEHEVPITVAPVAAFTEHAHREHTGVELVDLIVTLPHLDQRLRADDEWPRPLRPLEVAYYDCPDVALAQANDVRDERPAALLDHAYRLPEREPLEVRELLRDVAVHRGSFLLAFQPVPYERV